MLKHLHHKVISSFSGLTPYVIIVFCLLLLLILGWLDVVTGDYSLIVFYLIPVSLAAWFVNRACGVLFCFLATIVRLVADEGYNTALNHSILHYWNELIEFTFLLIMTLLFSALKKNFENEQELARRDSLTNALNRRSFFDIAEYELKRSKRYNLPLTVAYIDVDNFKLVNDQLGHKTGDELLLSVVSTIMANIRNSDLLARFGGDEFVILLPDTSGDAAIKCLDKIHSHLNQVMSEKSWPVSFSIGVVTYIKMPSTVDQLISQADDLMYRVKHGGKNSVLYMEIEEI